MAEEPLGWRRQEGSNQKAKGKNEEKGRGALGIGLRAMPQRCKSHTNRGPSRRMMIWFKMLRPTMPHS
jgi:hypothetical protein